MKRIYYVGSFIFIISTVLTRTGSEVEVEIYTGKYQTYVIVFNLSEVDVFPPDLLMESVLKTWYS